MLRSRFGSSRLSCCIVQLEPVHEEITPSFVLALNELGFHVDVYLPKKSLINKGDIYEFISGLDVSVYYWKPEKRAKTWNALRQSIVGSGYSFCVFSTFQFPGCIAFAKHLNIPIFGVVHNPNAFVDSVGKESANYFDQINLKGLFVLAGHVKDALLGGLSGLDARFAAVPIGVVKPYFWRQPHQVYAGDQKVSRNSLVIPGGVNYRNRDLLKLLDIVEGNSLISENLHFVVAGGGVDRPDFEKRVADRKLLGCFEFLPVSEMSGLVLYSDYYRALDGSSFCLPLSLNKEYSTSKITSALPTSIGFGLPALIPIDQAKIYQVPAISYEGTLEQGLLSLIDFSSSEFKQVRFNLLSCLLASFCANATSVAETISECVVSDLFARHD